MKGLEMPCEDSLVFIRVIPFNLRLKYKHGDLLYQHVNFIQAFEKLGTRKINCSLISDEPIHHYLGGLQSQM
jgi:hypothetical protein